MSSAQQFPATVCRIKLNEQTTVLAIRVPSLAQGCAQEYQRAFVGLSEVPVFVDLTMENGHVWLDVCMITDRGFSLYQEFAEADAHIEDWRKLDWREEYFYGIPPSNWEWQAYPRLPASGTEAAYN